MSTESRPGASVRDLPPNIFAVVMATGIVAVAMNAAGMRRLALGLFGVGVAAYVTLLALLLSRCVRYPAAVVRDAGTHAAAPGFFTLVAATGVLGNGCVSLIDSPDVGVVMWGVAILFWAGLTYTVLPQLMEADNKPPLEKGLNGGWLLAVVATQSVSVLGSLCAPHLPADAVEVGVFMALCFWLVGVMLYLWLISLVFYRVMFLPLSPADLAPPYWINMGAMAISTLAGATMIGACRHLAAIAELLPFLKGVTLLCWATATWWVPMLLALGVWRHVAQRFPIRYDHGFWAVVFPLGMYSACTFRLSSSLNLSFLNPLAHVFAWVALAAWVLVFAGLLERTGRGVMRSPVRSRVPAGEPADSPPPSPAALGSEVPES